MPPVLYPENVLFRTNEPTHSDIFQACGGGGGYLSRKGCRNDVLEFVGAPMYLIGGIRPEVPEASGLPSAVGTLLGHLRHVPNIDPDADEQKGKLGLDQHPGHLGPPQEDVVRPFE